MSEITMQIGQMIKEARAKKGLSQRELGKIMGVTGVTINNYENGQQNLTVDTLKKVSEALGVTLKISLE